MTYLCGPINGCSDDEAYGWRERVEKALGPENVLNPMRRDYRGLEHLNVAEIVEGDKCDISRCDTVLVNYSRPTIGTCMEIMFAHSLGKRVVVVTPVNARVSPWLKYHSTYICHGMREALLLI